MTIANPSYPLAKDGVFWTIQGEGHLRGFHMCFIRLAGCSVGCAECDTDYAKHASLKVSEIVDWCDSEIPRKARDRWVWITGGEPADHDLRPLIAGLRANRMSIAVASSGHKRVIPPVDWLSISPHDPSKWIQTYGNEVKIVPGLNGFSLADFRVAHPDDQTDFLYRYVQPLSVRDQLSDSWEEDKLSLEACLAFLKTEPNWALSRQDHHHWSVR